ncbi:MAG: hypothetical protein ACPGLV_10380 [Bacteroidia bacterium]
MLKLKVPDFKWALTLVLLIGVNKMYGQETTQLSVDFECLISPQDYGYRDPSGFYIYQLELGQKFGLNVNLGKGLSLRYQYIYITSFERYFPSQSFSLNSIQLAFRRRILLGNFIDQFEFSLAPSIAQGAYCFSDYYSHCSPVNNLYLGLSSRIDYDLGYRWYVNLELNYMRPLNVNNQNRYPDVFNWFWFGLGYTPFYRLDKTR